MRDLNPAQSNLNGGRSEDVESSPVSLPSNTPALPRDELSLPLALQRSLALYVHLPFCARRCPYCDFATARLDREQERRYLAALAAEAAARLPAGFRPRTVYLGGGTPGELTTPGLEELVALLAPWTAGAVEVTVEANPRTLLPRKLATLRDGLGATRVSLGAQSFDPAALRRLGRFHRPEDVGRAVDAIRAAGIDDISIDLMFGLPGQTPADVAAEVDAAVALEPTHVSTYCLTLEPGTRFAERQARGALRLPAAGQQGRLFGVVRSRLRAAGFQHYEISNFARPGARCRHNLVYWRNGPSCALGASAAAHVGGVRTTNHRDVAAYIQAVEAGGGAAAVADREVLPRERKIRETAYLALRTSEGIVSRRFRRDTGVDPAAFFRDELARLEGLGLIERRPPGRLRLTGRGVSLADAVATELL